MNLKAVTLATILGLSAPAIADITLNTSVLAQARTPMGMFQDSEWSVTISYNRNTLNYYGRNLRTGNGLSLRGATVGGNSQHRIYTWSNGDHRYQVTWQTSDPDFIRLQVLDPRGRVVLNRLLSRSSD